jgi:hypothetical protein
MFTDQVDPARGSHADEGGVCAWFFHALGYRCIQGTKGDADGKKCGPGFFFTN